MSGQHFDQLAKDEISLRDIISFLIDFWKVIFVAGVVGVMAALGFLMVTPSQFEALARIELAQSSKSGGVVEDPNLLIARLKLPTSYGAEEINSCGLRDSKFAAEAISGIANVVQAKGASSVIELRVRMHSKNQALTCAEALFQYIKYSQYIFIKPYIEDSKNLVTQHQNRLLKLQKDIEKYESDGVRDSLIYLSIRDEVRFLREEVTRLNSIVANSNHSQARLLAPIFVSDFPAFPRKKITLATGLFIGLLLGFLSVFAFKGLGRIKAISR